MKIDINEIRAYCEAQLEPRAACGDIVSLARQDAFSDVLDRLDMIEQGIGDIEDEPQELDSEEDNLARFAMYWYGDDDSMFLSNVFVGKDMRHHGCGNFILEVADEVANMYNADRIYLKTKKGSFAHKWYKRHGYVDDETDEEDKTMIWMKKEV